MNSDVLRITSQQMTTHNDEKSEREQMDEVLQNIFSYMCKTLKMNKSIATECVFEALRYLGLY